MKVGGDRLIDIDIRLITATNKNLEAAVREGTFRSDLYFRLNVLPLVIPPPTAPQEGYHRFAAAFSGG